jgi:hypothetical protein
LREPEAWHCKTDVHRVGAELPRFSIVGRKTEVVHVEVALKAPLFDSKLFLVRFL